MNKLFLRILPVLLMASFLIMGCNQKNTTGITKDVQPATTPKQVQEKNVVKGKIVGKSGKAKSISIMVGKGDKAKTMLVKFDDATKGVEHATKGSAAIIKYKVVVKDKIATVIKPKLAKLPAGVTEILPADLIKMIANNENFILIDSRPEKRFHGGTISGSISISVPAMKKNATKLLPTDKNIQLVFYCGGVT